ncbi:hypothetical protein C0989_008313 [Termitomyces sp. Mn162]|nr:hypothetical protein C0989_008313 [Termitomyces sp. Mn162]
MHQSLRLATEALTASTAWSVVLTTTVLALALIKEGSSDRSTIAVSTERASPSATVVIDLMPAELMIVHTIMHALSVERPHTLHRTALHEQFFPISIPLKVKH